MTVDDTKPDVARTVAQKSPGAFRTISEVADELGVQQHVLRFWESKFAQIKPIKRGGGRRYYRPEDVDLLRAIQSLLYNDRYTIKGVQKLIRDHGVKAIIGLSGGLAAGLGAVRLAVMDSAHQVPGDGRTLLHDAATPAVAAAAEEGRAPVPADRSGFLDILKDLEDIRDELLRGRDQVAP